MQKIKKGGIWLVSAILLIPNAFAYVLPYFDTNEILVFYQQNYLFVDFILAWMLFGSIARIFVEKKFGGSISHGTAAGATGNESPAVKPLYLSIGLILALGIVGLEIQYPNLSFLSTGPLSIVLLLALLGSGLWEIFKGEGREKNIGWAKVLITIALIAVIMSFMFPNLSSTAFSTNWTGNISWMTLLAIAAILGAIIFFIKFFWLGRKSRSTEPLLEPDEERRRREAGERPEEKRAGEEPRPEAAPGRATPTPAALLNQLTEFRRKVEVYVNQVNTIQRRGGTINTATSTMLLTRFNDASNELRELIRMPTFNLISRTDMNIFIQLLRMFANGIIVSRGFTVR